MSDATSFSTYHQQFNMSNGQSNKLDSMTWTEGEQTMSLSLSAMEGRRAKRSRLSALLTKDVLDVPTVGRHADTQDKDDSVPEMSPLSTSTSASSLGSFTTSPEPSYPGSPKPAQLNGTWQDHLQQDVNHVKQDKVVHEVCSSAGQDVVSTNDNQDMEPLCQDDQKFDALVHLILTERSLPPPIDYATCVQQDYKSTDRCRLVSFIHASAVQFGFTLHTCRVALSTFDRFMSQWSVREVFLDLTALCCLSLSARLIEDCDNGLERFAGFKNDQYSMDEMRDMENLIFSTLNGIIIDVTPHFALTSFGEVFACWMPQDLLELSGKVLDASYYLPEHQTQLSSTLAMACMLSSLIMTAHYVQAYEFIAHCENIMGPGWNSDSIWSISVRLCARFDETHQLRVQAAANHVQLASAASVLQIPIIEPIRQPMQQSRRSMHGELSDITRTLQFDDAFDEEACA